jgi:predicted TIM-barrel enzyme
VLAYGNANEIVRDMAWEVLPVVKHTPVLAGVNGTDPFCMFDPFLDDLKRLGFSGVQNFPTVGLIEESCEPIQKRQACPTRPRSR